MTIPAATAYYQVNLGPNSVAVWSAERRTYVPLNDSGLQEYVASGRIVVLLENVDALNRVLADLDLGDLAPVNLEPQTENWRAMIRRRAAKLGNTIEAVLLLKTIGE